MKHSISRIIINSFMVKDSWLKIHASVRKSCIEMTVLLELFKEYGCNYMLTYK